MTQKRVLFDVRFSILVGLQLAILAAVALAAVKFSRGGMSEEPAPQHREVAMRLHAAGLAKEAAEHYARYLAAAGLSAGEKARTALTIGELFESAGEFEKALSYYYLVEVHSGQGSELQKKAAGHIVAILEQLKKFGAAKLALRSSTALSDEKKRPSGAVVVAKVGDSELYQSDLDEALDLMPEAVRQQFSKPEDRKRLLQKLVADELLYQKGLRLKLNEDSAYKKHVTAMMKQLVVQKVVENEVTSKIAVDEADLKNYFEANKKKYADGKTADAALFAKVRPAVLQDYKLSKAQSLYQQLVEETLAQGQVKLFEENVK
jgi:hypothetical protein